MHNDRHLLTKFIYVLSVTLILLCGFTANVAAQSEASSAALEGVITAPDGKVIAGATVSVHNAETGYARALTTNERGQFIASVMPSGLPLHGRNFTDFIQLTLGIVQE